ncbi:DUF2934 domain-containing protein [Devosia sp. XJ19-1]|uniref:DUF2934 domain-containing protein n=1 Tax=Devosia ureilytica TaxID=2952754 RepID=A0A9Q4APY5_9HYPH|nr:DUF2934 domain-containing protein [Devosia ureilytica]MCP8884077.1 DUF2934 domain-containing protein [Devosia ureilytica]MCP8887685.1 DUF2934 domain-containing protein [Devosia ureilytica]
MFKNTAMAEQIRQTAYFLWENDGRPEGKAMDYWVRAKQLHQRQLAYDRWLADGAPLDRSEVHWIAAEKDLSEE